MLEYAPPLVVDVIWVGEADGDVRRTASGLYEMLHRELDLGRDEDGGIVLPEEDDDPTMPKARVEFGSDETLDLPPNQIPGRAAPYWRNLAGRRALGIPVFMGRSAARLLELTRQTPKTHRVVVPVFPPGALQLEGIEITRFMAGLKALQAAGAHVLHVPLSSAWLGKLGDDEIPLRNHLFPSADPAQDRRPAQELIDEGIAVSLCRLLSAEHQVQVFISHAKSDLVPTEHVASAIKSYLDGQSLLGTFFDAKNLEHGKKLNEELERAQEHGMLLCVLGDDYADSPYCQAEMLTAKRRGLPVVTVACLHRGETRSLSYGGNHQRIPWPLGSPNPGVALARIARACTWAMLHHCHFLRVGDAVKEAANLSLPMRVISRNPESVDLGTGLIPRDTASVVVYPDPPLSYVEAEPLSEANPRCDLVTPSTLLARLEGPSGNGSNHAQGILDTGAIPLGNLRVALSASSAGDDAPHIRKLENRKEGSGLVHWHVDEAIAQVVQSLIRSGAELGYGGHLAITGFTQLLVELLERHHRTARTPDIQIRSYLVPASRALVKGGATGSYIVDVPTTDGAPAAWQYTEMRAFMANHAADDDAKHDELDREESRRNVCHARVCIGGKLTKYGGAYPGIAEEAWWTVASSTRRDDPKPLYVLGGFGGASAAVAQCLDPDRPLPSTLTSAEANKENGYAQRLGVYLDWSKKSGVAVPASVDELVQDLRAYGERLREAGPTHNGLSWEENRRLWSTPYALEASALVVKGLLTWRRQHRRGDASSLLPVVVWRGDVLDADTDAIAFASIGNSRLFGLDSRILQAAGREPDAEPQPPAGKCRMLGLPSQIGARFGLWATFGDPDMLDRPDAQERLAEHCREAARVVAREAGENGIRSIAFVPMGTNLGLDVRRSVRETLAGVLAAEAAGAQRLDRIVICETEVARHRQVLQTVRKLRSSGPIELIERRAQVGVEEQDAPLILRLTSPDGSSLDVELDRPGQAVLYQARIHPMWDAIKAVRTELAAPAGTTTPIHALGHRVAEAAFPQEMRELLSGAARPLEVRHDAYAGRIPLELVHIATDEDQALEPLIQRGVTRRPLDLRASKHHAQRDNSSSWLRVLMVADPTGDLPGTRKEQARLREKLRERTRAKVELLLGNDASLENILEELKKGVDVLHYAGHALLDDKNPAGGGLIVAGHKRLRAGDLEALSAGTAPSLVFLNACESAAVAWEFERTSDAFTIADKFLAAGVRNLVGSSWPVGDEAAFVFADAVYEDLLSGRSIGVAVRHGRWALQRDKSPDAYNYLLYGEASTRLITST